MPLQRRFSILLGLTLFIATAPAEASTASPGTVFDLVVAEYISIPDNPPEAGFFKTTGTRTGTIPACATLTRWVFPLNTPAGQGILATLLTAKATGKTIAVDGTGDCKLGTASETVGLVRLND